MIGKLRGRCWGFAGRFRAIELDRVVVLHIGRDARDGTVERADRQTWLIAVHEWHSPKMSVALSAARRAQRAHGVEPAGRGNFVSRRNAENSEGSDKWGWLRGIAI